MSCFKGFANDEFVDRIGKDTDKKAITEEEPSSLSPSGDDDFDSKKGGFELII